MRKNALLMGLTLVLFACNSVEKFRAPIEELVGSWDTTTAAVTEFVGQLGAEQTKANNMLAQMTVPEDLAGKMDEAATAKVGELKASFTEQLGSLSTLNETVTGFVSQWTEKAAEVNTLKEGLAAGKLSGDVMGQIADLKEMVASATTNLEGWKGSLAGITNNLGGISQQFTTLLDGLASMASKGKK
ncbi:MAG: hypothetical protein H6562_01000 [Lewinellaceae bacterium]|nr:hypothetical protein [Lewinellaceae bacterium]